MKPKSICLLLFSIALTKSAWGADSPALAGKAPPASQPVAALAESKRLVDRADERITVLENGLKILLKAHRTAPVVSVRMYCQTGSIYEQEYLGTGISHLFEHLLHGGATTTRTEEESRIILDDIGGNTNAYTSYDVTCYYINTARKHTEQAIQLLGDWITDPTFPEGAFGREWEVVQRELERDLDDPSRQIFQMTMEAMYREHPARYPVIGHQPIVQKVKKEDIVAYYQRMYVPDNIVVCIAGDIDLDETLRMVQHEFASFSRRPVPTIVLPQEPEMPTPREVTKRMKVPAAMMQLAYPSIPLTHPDLYALDLLSYILTQGDSSRLSRTIRDRGLVFNIDSSSWTPAWARGIFAISARLAPDLLDEAKSAILEQIVAVQKDLIDPEELLQAKQQKAAEHVFASQTAESVAEMMAHDFLSTGDAHFSQAYVDNIQKVTAEEVREVARKYLVPQRLATIRVLPEGFKNADEKADQAAAPEPIHMFKLDNGLRCLVRRDPTTPLVAIQSFSLGGVLFENDRSNGFSRLAALLAQRGTTKRSAEEIARFFDSRGASFDSTSASNTIYFQAQVLKKDFDDALNVFADVITDPAFPEPELEKLKPRLLDQIDQLDETWRTETITLFQNRLFQHSPYRMPSVGSAEVVSKATRDQIADFYHRCVTAPNTVLAIFGDVDPANVEALVRKQFATLTADKTPIPTAKPEQKIETPVAYIKPKDPTRGVAGIGLGFLGMKMVEVEDAVPAAVLDTIISGYRYPTGWLHEALRGGEASFVYEVHAQNVPGVLPGYFAIYAACQPEQVNRVWQIISKQLERARQGEFTEAELEQAKVIISTTELTENQTNADRAMQSSIHELYGLGYDYHQKFNERVNAVTLADVRRVATKYLTAPTIVVVTPAPDKVDLGIKTVVVESASPEKQKQAESDIK